MKHLFRVATIVSALIMTAPGHATCYGYYCQSTIAQLSIANDAILIRLTDGVSGLTNCTPAQTDWLTLPKSNSYYKDYYVALLAAQLSNHVVTIRTLDGSSNCTLSYITVP